MRSLLRSKKAQFFVLSAFAIVSILLLVSRWFEPLSISDTSSVALAEEPFIFNNIKEKAIATVATSKNCNEVRNNLEEYKIFIQDFVTVTKNLKMSFEYEVVEPCSDAVLRTKFNISLESPSTYVFSNFTSSK